MEKTDSILNLTKSSLYGIYNSSKVDISQENDQVEEYLEGMELHIKAKDNVWVHAPQNSRGRPGRSVLLSDYQVERNEFPSYSPLGTVGRLAIVTLAAWTYNAVTRNIHMTHSDGRGSDINSYLNSFLYSLQPFQELMDRYGFRLFGIEHADYVLTLMLEGVALSVVVPVLDRFMPAGCLRRMLSSNPKPYMRSNLANDILRSLIAFLGILYAIRKVEWKSSLQMAMTWSLINPGLWLLLDGTISGFVASIIVAGAGLTLIYIQNSLADSSNVEHLPTVFLFIGSFFFCGVIIFGKLGRFLFS